MPGEKVDFRLERQTVEETDLYVRERLVYWTRPGLQATAYLLLPKSAPLPAPAVLCLHGHSRGGKDDAIDPGSIYRGFGRRFAEEGCVVLCPDQIGFGERTLPDGPVTYQVLVHGLNMLGHTLIGVRYWDLVRALDLLAELPQVQAGRIGVMGLSLGGEMTLFLDAGRQDPSFPWQEARALVRRLRPVYRLYGRPRTHLGLEIHDGAHEISGRQSVPWMLKQLRETA